MALTQSKKKEDFRVFLYDFSRIKDYQLSRIKFPLLDCFVSRDDSLCKKLSEEKWVIVELLKENKVEQIYNNFALTMEDTDERVFSITGIENGAGVYYYFKREKGKWFLAKRVVYDD